MTLPRLSLCTALVLSALSTLNAQSVATAPVGAVTLSIAASSNGTSFNISQVSIPLLGTPYVPGVSGAELASGSHRGVISSVGSNTITTTSAGWTAGQLSQTGFPMFARVLSGNNAGRCYLVTSNTDSSLTVDNQGTDLTTLGFVTGGSGDRYEIVAGDTISGLFGTPTEGVVGGTATDFSQNRTDRVTISVGASIFNYYYNTDFNQWRRSGSSLNQGNVVISPQAGVIYQRIGTTPLTITAIGSVPVGTSRLLLTRPSVSIIGRQFPTDTTLSALGIESVANWKKANSDGVTVAGSDRVLVKVGATIFSYYYDAALSQWRRSGSSLSQNSVAIAADSAVRIQRSGTSGADLWSLSPNFSL